VEVAEVVETTATSAEALAAVPAVVVPAATGSSSNLSFSAKHIQQNS
jgi:hypothetical protein